MAIVRTPTLWAAFRMIRLQPVTHKKPDAKIAADAIEAVSCNRTIPASTIRSGHGHRARRLILFRRCRARPNNQLVQRRDEFLASRTRRAALHVEGKGHKPMFSATAVFAMCSQFIRRTRERRPRIAGSFIKVRHCLAKRRLGRRAAGCPALKDERRDRDHALPSWWTSGPGASWLQRIAIARIMACHTHRTQQISLNWVQRGHVYLPFRGRVPNSNLPYRSLRIELWQRRPRYFGEKLRERR